MSTTQNEDIRVFDEYHFASEYERFAAAIIARIPQVGRAVTARLFADNDFRDLLALDIRPESYRHRKRLHTDEVAGDIRAITARAAAIARLGAFNAPLFRNVHSLGNRLNLSAAERAILVLAVLVDALAIVRQTMDVVAVFARDRGAAASALAALLEQDRAEIHKALLPSATLMQTDLIRLNLHDEDEYFVRARPALAAILFDEFAEEDALFAQFASLARAPALTVIDFSHLERDVGFMVSLLDAAVREREPGVNILLYGPPGTGKTELARVLANEASLRLYEVRHTDADGQSLTQARYAQALLAQSLLSATERAVLLFDETEDLFPANHSMGEGSGRLGKAAFNHLLETNRTPMIWISNRVNHIDRAYLRRFAYVLDVKTPNRAVRRRVVHRAFDSIVANDQWLESVAEHAELAPGQVAQAARVARLLRKSHDVVDVADQVLRNGMRCLGQSTAHAREVDTRFDLRNLNCNADVQALVTGMARDPRGSMVFFGPPGTGKTALANYIAVTADRPLLVKRASDLLSPWVGESERAIAEAFAEARDERAVLTIDEADSFLSDRRETRARWELTETNEMLTQMERFDGLFICSTNLMERLDRAALRRFAIKLRFDYLRPDQVSRLIEETLHAIGAKGDVAAALAMASQLKLLTPGDIAAVVRRCRMLGETMDAKAFLLALRDEVELKGEGGVQRIGF